MYNFNCIIKNTVGLLKHILAYMTDALYGHPLFFCLFGTQNPSFCPLSLRTHQQEVKNMTNEQIRQLAIMRRDGMGYGAIADKLDLSINTVKSWCRRHQLPSADSISTVCEQCGKPITQNPKRKKKRFCSDRCRNL